MIIIGVGAFKIKWEMAILLIITGCIIVYFGIKDIGRIKELRHKRRIDKNYSRNDLERLGMDDY